MVAVASSQRRLRPLTDIQVEAALLDPCVFIDRYCWIRGKGGTTERFRLVNGWEFQGEIVRAMDEEDRLLILKARQLGISWTGDAFALWLCTANRGQTVLILSQGQRESKEEMRRIRFMHKMLPPELRRATGGEILVAKAPDTTEQLEFPEMDSRIISMPSTEHAGTSFTATLVIIHELAKIKNARSLVTAIIPTMADHGRFFVISTAFGYSGVFYEYWRDNQHLWHEGQIVGDKPERGGFRPVFIPWMARPGRDQAWYDATATTMTGKEVRQEYPATSSEAFQGTTDAVFAEEFDRHHHGLDSSRHPDSNYETVVGIDIGVHHALAYLMEIQARNVFVYHEIHLRQKSVSEMGKDVYDALLEFGLDPAQVMVYVDPAAAGTNMQTLKTDYDVLTEEGLLCDRSGLKYTPSQRVSIIKVLLRNDRLWISLDCSDLLDALERAMWATRRAADGEIIKLDTYAKDGKYEHPLDAHGYALCQIFPPIAVAGVETAVVSTGVAGIGSSVGYGYSGSEFGG
jgi:hypothetical protein